VRFDKNNKRSRKKGSRIVIVYIVGMRLYRLIYIEDKDTGSGNAGKGIEQEKTDLGGEVLQ